jgi:hypothetical protein
MGECFIITENIVKVFEPFSQLFNASGTFVVPASGTYRITAIGKGASGYNALGSHYDGGCGGGGYIEKKLVKGESLTVTIGNNAEVAGIISATASSGRNAGTVTGEGVTPFSSNGKATKNIEPPDFYNKLPYISFGGLGGDRLSASGNYTQNVGNAGGAGLFGGNGGHGGLGAVIDTGGSYKGIFGAGEPGNAGGGNGGAGARQGSQSTSIAGHGGGGGGGGYGGGGGRGTYNEYYYGGNNEAHAESGVGGAACVFIDRIS